MSFKKPFRAVPVQPVKRSSPRPLHTRTAMLLFGAVGIGLVGGVASTIIHPAETAMKGAIEADRSALVDHPSSVSPIIQTAADLDSEQPNVARLEGMAAPRQVDHPPGGSTWSYPNCSAARAAGVAPLYAGQSGYGPHLDRDSDGIACEPYRAAP